MVEIVNKDRKASSGTFLSFSDESVSLKAADGDKTIPRPDVVRVRRYGGKRGRNAWIGLAAGAGAGVGIGAAAGGCKSNAIGPCVGRGTAAGVAGAIGAIVGGGIGAAIPGKTAIYQARVR